MRPEEEAALLILAAQREGNFLAPWVRRILSEAIAREKRREKRESTHGR